MQEHVLRGGAAAGFGPLQAGESIGSLLFAMHVQLERAGALVAAGDSHTALVVDGTLHSWGHGGLGRLGHRGSADKQVPRAIRALAHKTVIQITAGNLHTAAVTDNGELFTFGFGGNGRSEQFSESLRHCVTVSLHHRLAVSLNHCVTAPPSRCITASLAVTR